MNTNTYNKSSSRQGSFVHEQIIAPARGEACSTMEEEIWKDVPGYEGAYQVSSLGRIRSIERVIAVRKDIKRIQRARIMTPTANKAGYMYITLGVKRFAIHRLVLMAFDWRSDVTTLQGNHKDGVKSNNALSNLEWATPSENRIHSLNVLGNLPPTPKKGAENWSSQPVIGRNTKTGEIKEYGCMADAVAEGHRLTDISNCTGHRQRTARGWEWRKPEQEWRNPKEPRPELLSCRNGHSYSLENTFFNKRGSKVCRTCSRISCIKANKKYRLKKTQQP